MTDQSSPITPPPELVRQWSDIKPMENAVVQNWVKIATRAAQWGADQELEACCHVIETQYGSGSRLRAARRPKPPRLKEQALAAVAELEGFKGVDTIRLALEALPND